MTCQTRIEVKRPWGTYDNWCHSVPVYRIEFKKGPEGKIVKREVCKKHFKEAKNSCSFTKYRTGFDQQFKFEEI